MRKQIRPFVALLVFMSFSIVALADAAFGQRRDQARDAHSLSYPAPAQFRARAAVERLATVRRLRPTRLTAGELPAGFSLTPRAPFAAGHGFLQSVFTNSQPGVGQSGAIYGNEGSALFVQVQGISQGQVLLDCAITMSGSMQYWFGTSATPAGQAQVFDGLVSVIAPVAEGGVMITLKPYANSFMPWTLSGCEVTVLPI